MPRITRKPNIQLKQIVLQETNDGRDVVRYLKSTFMEIEDAPRLFGLSPKDYARTHKIAAARILARLGLEEGKRYLRRNYVQTPFRRVHPEDEDGPKRDVAASTADLYRLVRRETNDGRDIIIRFVEIMKGYHPEYKPHLRMAAAKELIRQIEFDYDEEQPTPPTPTSAESIREPVGANSQITPHQDNHTNHSSDTNPRQANPVHPTNPEHPTSDNPQIKAHQGNHTNHSSDANPYTQYSIRNCAEEAESIYRSIIRRASDRPNLDSAKREAKGLIEEFNQFIAERDPRHDPVTVPEDILARSLTQRMENPESYLFDPSDYYDLDRDDFYYCRCEGCEECDELEDFFEFMRELEEDTAFIYEDP